jgi:hypothetical protein
MNPLHQPVFQIRRRSSGGRGKTQLLGNRLEGARLLAADQAAQKMLLDAVYIASLQAADRVSGEQVLHVSLFRQISHSKS